MRADGCGRHPPGRLAGSILRAVPRARYQVSQVEDLVQCAVQCLVLVSGSVGRTEADESIWPDENCAGWTQSIAIEKSVEGLIDGQEVAAQAEHPDRGGQFRTKLICRPHPTGVIRAGKEDEPAIVYVDRRNSVAVKFHP